MEILERCRREGDPIEEYRARREALADDAAEPSATRASGEWSALRTGGG